MWGSSAMSINRCDGEEGLADGRDLNNPLERPLGSTPNSSSSSLGPLWTLVRPSYHCDQRSRIIGEIAIRISLSNFTKEDLECMLVSRACQVPRATSSETFHWYTDSTSTLCTFQLTRIRAVDGCPYYLVRGAIQGGFWVCQVGER